MIELRGEKVVLRTLEREHCRELWENYEPTDPLPTEPLNPGLSVEGAAPNLQYTGGKSKMEITTQQLKRVDVVTVNGRIDSSTAPELESALQSILDADRFRICMDLENLEYLSSAGIKVLISTLKTCKRWNRGDLRLANVPPYIAEVLDLAGLTPLFKTYPTLVEAVGSF